MYRSYEEFKALGRFCQIKHFIDVVIRKKKKESNSLKKEVEEKLLEEEEFQVLDEVFQKKIKLEIELVKEVIE